MKSNIIQINYPAFFQAVKNWQVNVMGNKCSICHGNNINTECVACHWWGKVRPNGFESPDDSSFDAAPKIESFYINPDEWLHSKELSQAQVGIEELDPQPPTSFDLKGYPMD